MRSRLVLSVLPAILCLAALAARAGATSPQSDDPTAAPRISQQEFKQAIADDGLLVLDVRDAGSYAVGHIPGAVSIPLDELPQHVADLKRETRPIVTYCS
jgi:predicted sulfurtransferase